MLNKGGSYKDAKTQSFSLFSWCSWWLCVRFFWFACSKSSCVALEDMVVEDVALEDVVVQEAREKINRGEVARVTILNQSRICRAMITPP